MKQCDDIAPARAVVTDVSGPGMGYTAISQKPSHFADEMQEDLDRLREKSGVSAAVRQLNEAHERGALVERERIRLELLHYLDIAFCPAVWNDFDRGFNRAVDHLRDFARHLEGKP